MSCGYSAGLTLERIDNNGNYCKENCRWATRKDQQRNRRGNVVISFQGEVMVQLDWAKKLGVHQSVISRYLSKGKDFQWIYDRFKNRNKLKNE